MAVSKNNPNARKAAIQKKYNDKIVKPVKVIGDFGTFIAAQYESGDVVLDADGNPIPYKKLDNSN